MKKALVLVLAVVLAMSLAVPAAAVDSPTAAPPLPEVVVDESTTESIIESVIESLDESVLESLVGSGDTSALTVVVDVVPVEEAENMEEEAKETFVAAQETLEEVVPEGMNAKSFFYFSASIQNKEDDTKEAVKITAPITVTLKLDTLSGVDTNSKVDTISKVVVKQFVDGKWVELKTTINPDGTITIEGVVEGPIAIFTA